MKIVELDLSDSGRCFVVGEVSGHFFALKQMLRELDFDPDKDILVLNGNFTGYCLSSRDLTAWLDKPWVIALLGRSEVELLSRLEGGAKPSLVGQWLGMLSVKERSRIKDLIQDRPFVAEIKKESMTVVVSHCALPAGVTWGSFRTALLERNDPKASSLDVFEDRHSDLRALGMIQGYEADVEPVKGIVASISSFRDEAASDKIGRSGNRYFLKCSAHMNHGPHYKQSCILPYVDIEHFFQPEVCQIWSKGQDTQSDAYQKMTSCLKQRYINVQ